MDTLHLSVDLRDRDSLFIYRFADKIDVPILYEDNHIIVAVKPAGVLSQSDGGSRCDMLAILKQYLKMKYNKQGDVFLGLLHRLDCPVSGIMVFARTSKAASRISQQIRDKAMLKRYYAIVNGLFKDGSGRIDLKLLKEAGNIVTINKEGKESSLSYEVLSYNPTQDLSLLDINLETGRAHQIRASFAHIGHHLYGDRKYGNGVSDTDNPMLFAYRLSFNHPVKDQICDFNAIPDNGDFQKYFSCYFSLNE